MACRRKAFRCSYLSRKYFSTSARVSPLAGLTFFRFASKTGSLCKHLQEALGVGMQDVATGLGDGRTRAGVQAQLSHKVSRFPGGVFVSRCRDEGAVDCGAGGDEGASRPPEVEGGDVSFADRLLPPRLGGDGFDGDVVFDQAVVCDGNSPSGRKSYGCVSNKLDQTSEV